jgi:2-aminoadipate transaminase
MPFRAPFTDRGATSTAPLCPGLRIGWLIPPAREREAVLETKHARDLQAGSLAQSIAWHFLANDDFDARLGAARMVYARRAARLMAALRRWLPSARFQEPAGGFSVFVESDAEGDDIAFLAHALQHGVSVDPGSQFRPDARANGPMAFRLCYSAVSEARLEEAVQRLARALHTFSTQDDLPL